MQNDSRLIRTLFVQVIVWSFFACFSAHARDLEVVAHRGANHLAPENTMAAAWVCVELGVDFVEIDVRTSKDGVLYVLHDATLDRTTNGTGRISEVTSEYIDSLDAGSWFDPRFKDEKVPRLETFLKTFSRRINIYYDVKDADLTRLLDLIKKYRGERKCFFWFSDDQRALELRKLDKYIPLKMNAVDVAGLKRVLAYNPQIIEYRLENLTPDFVRFCRQNDLKLMAHALGDGAEDNYETIVESSADMVNLDKADQMLKILGRSPSGRPLRRTMELGGVERDYYIRLPNNFDPEKKYWPLVTVHGAGGSGKNDFLADGMQQKANVYGLDAIIISPNFSNEDSLASSFPSLGEGRFLKLVLGELHGEYNLESKILLTGFSRGGQFSHRFAFANPGLVRAVAAFSSGSWTTPDGRLLIQKHPPIENPKEFFSSAEKAADAPESMKFLFNPQFANIAGNRADPEANKIPFLVMCGKMDGSRLPLARDFALSLIEAGFEVEAGWPKVPHGATSTFEFQSEYESISSRTIEFFQRVVDGG